MRNGVLHINGAPVKKERTGDYVDPYGEGGGRPVPQYEETLPNGVKYHVLDTQPFGAADNTEEYVVPEGHYFMMGDNRDNSQDSRYQDEVGYVPIENFVGRADIIFFSVSPKARIWEVWKWPIAIRWSRFFNLI
jgi:signal peptidase I